MGHECENCGESFETLSRLRLHDCQSSNDTGQDVSGATERPGAGESDSSAEQRLAEQISRLTDGDHDVVYQALATYDVVLSTAHEAGATDRYRDLSQRYRESLIEGMDRAAQVNGWSVIQDAIDAYHPETSDEYPHVTTTIQNVAARHVIRTRLRTGIGAVPTAVLDYFAWILSADGDLPDFIREGSHPYGWGIGHPDHSVADRLYEAAMEDLILVGAILEHAFYADQHAAMDVVERLIHDDAIQHTLSHPGGEVNEVRMLLDAPAGAASQFSPTMPRYWDWETQLRYSFELDDTVEDRIRALVAETGIDEDLPARWDVSDLTL
jgi:hypothetical protein